MNCFSPPVMLATFLIEMALAGLMLWRYKMNNAARIIVVALVCLATFQLAEYFVCGGVGPVGWSRIGYVAITALPPLGLHLMYVLAGKKKYKLPIFAYVTMVGFMIYFVAIESAFRGQECTGNYVIFQLGERASIMYGFYYYGWLLAALSLGMRWVGQLQGVVKEIKIRRRTIKALMIGYAVFLVPTAVANSINPETRRGIPSIMCGFAVLFALILALYILPMASRRRT